MADLATCVIAEAQGVLQPADEIARLADHMVDAYELLVIGAAREPEIMGMLQSLVATAPPEKVIPAVPIDPEFRESSDRPWLPWDVFVGEVRNLSRRCPRHGHSRFCQIEGAMIGCSSACDVAIEEVLPGICIWRSELPIWAMTKPTPLRRRQSTRS